MEVIILYEVNKLLVSRQFKDVCFLLSLGVLDQDFFKPQIVSQEGVIGGESLGDGFP